MESKLTTFWELINENNNITVPIIQRDYAQGRVENRFKRKSFLEDIKKTLDSGNKMNLYYVYGNTISNAFSNAFLPLDGQQRLTTLWLVHWYVAYMSGNLKDNATTLARFSYHTRDYSRSFCEKLCTAMKSYREDNQPSSLVDHIKNQNWFASKWIQDPTIVAMLRTIEDVEDKKSDIRECDLMKIFAPGEDINVVESTFKDYWDKLTDKGLITFYIKEFTETEIPVPDELYIKMNARGKALNNLENFKAEFENQLSGQDREEFSKCFDGKWTNKFWNAARTSCTKDFNGNIDKSMYAFFNRFTFVKFAVCTDVPSSRYEKREIKDKDKKDKAKLASLKKRFRDFDSLYCDAKGTSDSEKEFADIETYEYIFNSWKEIISILNMCSDSDVQDRIDKYLKEGFNIIPLYEDGKNENVAAITQKEYVYFAAICLFLKSGRANYDGARFDSWLRVVRNITENADISTIGVMIESIRRITEIGEAAEKINWDVLTALKDYALEPGKTNEEVVKAKKVSKLDFQVYEEIVKAAKLTDASTSDTLKDEIYKAEEYAVFNGSVRFLFLNDGYDVKWSEFDTKYKTANQLFDNNSTAIKPSTTMTFLRKLRSLEQLNNINCYVNDSVNGELYFRNTFLLNPAFKEEVHQVLMGDTSEPSYDPDYDGFLGLDISDDDIRRTLDAEKINTYKVQMYYDHYVLHKAGSWSEYVYLSGKMIKFNKELLRLYCKGVISFDSSHLFKDNAGNTDSSLLYGNEVEFTLSGSSDTYVYEITNEKQTIVCRLKKTDANGKESTPRVCSDSTQLETTIRAL